MFLRRKRTSEQKDEDLVEQLRDGHQASLGVLWDRYAHLPVRWGAEVPAERGGEPRHRDGTVHRPARTAPEAPGGTFQALGAHRDEEPLSDAACAAEGKPPPRQRMWLTRT